MLDRFWSKVDKDGPVPAHRPELGPCWVWRPPGDKDGYGVFWDTVKSRKAHRASWEIHFGLILDGMCVLHKCDNTACVRPEHLFLGTVGDNQRDMVAKGRSLRGERNCKAKLDEFSVRLIRRLLKRGLSQAMLGRVFGVTKHAIHRIKTGARWGHVK